MKIPQSYGGILDKNIGLFKNDITSKPFIDKCFSDLFARSKTLSFQTRAKISGDMFEYLFYYLLNNRFDILLDAEIIIKKKYYAELRQKVLPNLSTGRHCRAQH